MPTKEQQRHKLINLLKKLFQLDQPDLDFGFYRVMHAKVKQITEFLDKDLLVVMEDAFGEVGENKKAHLNAEYEQALKTAKEYGAADPENAPKVMEARAKYEAAIQTSDSEGEICDHLYRFFERYYDNGDFISRRYHTRETSGKSAPFAIPYNGEEVKLVWANMDQYYIKTSEYFSNYTFDIMQAQEVQALQKEDSLGLFKDGEEKPRRVHFRIVEATEGEHGNVKASGTEKRYFIIHKDQPVRIDESSELVVNFEYRPDPEKSGQEGAWREKRNAEAVDTVLKTLDDLSGTKEYRALLKIPAPTEKQKDRPLLAKYINQYTARNTMDYFIHKDLGGFLKRELDFYIKNEVMRLDDIENADVPAVESYLNKIKVLRTIAGKLIDFLAQLEDFQKKLWLKKKFVVETNYCITLDRVPEALYPEIAANELQHDEWIKLFAIDEIQATNGDLFNGGNPGYVKPLTIDFLKANNTLVLDTRFFDEEFKAKLIASIENFDEQCDGMLIHSENFQALNLLQERYREQVKCIYFDPPYNTGDDGFAYKDSYQSSSWSSMLNQVIGRLFIFLDESGSLFANCDENEFLNFGHILLSVFGKTNHVETITWNKRVPKNDKGIGNIHEYIYLFAKNQKLRRANEREFVMRKDGLEEIYELIKKEKSKGSDLTMAQKALKKFYKKQGFDRGITLYCELDPNYEIFGKINMSWPNAKTEGPRYEVINPATGKPTPIPDRGWRWKEETFRKAESNGPTYELPDGSIIKGKIWYSPKETIQPSSITYLKEVESFLLRSIMSLKSDGSIQLDNLGLGGLIDYPKPVKLAEWIFYSVEEEDGFFLDCFAGSGTAAHGLISFNRQYPGQRKYILIEMADYFDTVLKPRITKVVYSESWKNGKPVAINNGQSTMNKKKDGSLFNGISHCFKYLRLESYEDTLNNLQFEENPVRDSSIKENEDLREDYMLHYLLDVETNGSQSLLNIDGFADPTAYTLNVKKPGSDEYHACNVDLMETFNYLIGLRVTYIDAPQQFTANFKREADIEIPEDQETRLVVDGRIRQDENGPWWFRKVEGWLPADATNPNNGKKEKVLIVWRKHTGDMEKDNVMLDEWFTRNRISTKDFEFDTIYVNGSNNLPNLKLEDDNWKVRLIEEEFMKRMWDVEEV